MNSGLRMGLGNSHAARTPHRSPRKAAGLATTRTPRPTASPQKPSAEGAEGAPRGDVGSRLLRWTQRLAVLAVGWFVALQPVGADDLWWQLARGRAAWQGALTPSASLLVLETRAEADWLGGLPLYAIYQLLGSAGWMLCRLVLVGLFLLAAVDSLRSRRVLALPPLLLVTCVLLAVAEKIDPVPRLFDLLGLVLIAWWCWPAFSRSLLNLESRQPTVVPSLLIVAGSFACWANVGQAVVAGAGLLLLAAIGETTAGQKTMFRRWGEFAVAMAAGSFNPRGLFVWTDSLVALMPNWVTPPSALQRTPWEALPGTAWGFGEWTFLGLTLAWIVNRGLLGRLRSRSPDSLRTDTTDAEGQERAPRARSRRPPRGLFLVELLPFAGMQWLAWNSVQNVSLATVWLAADVAFQWRAVGWWTNDEASLERNPARQGLWTLAGVVLIGSFLSISGLMRSSGWGVSASLDHRLMRIALAETRPYGTALADDVRSGGMLAWLLPRLPQPPDATRKNPLRLQDIASRAVTSGRLVQHQQLLDDLRRGRLMRYWRDDGSPGGYWLELNERETTLLCVSNRHLSLISGLEPSIWKPLSLDSPVIPYAQAGDDAYVRRLIAILRDRETIEYGDWQYQLPVSSGSPFDRDWFGLRPVLADPEPVLRQGEVFRAMDLHYAALRVLFVGRREFPAWESLAEAVVRCQLELADQELVDAGKASWFRFWASRYNAAAGALPPFAEPPQRGRVFGEGQGADRSSAANAAAVRVFKPRLEAYFRQGPVALLTGQWAGSHPQLQYAVLCAAIEAGQFERADRLIAALRKEPADDALLALVQQRERELHPPSDRGDE